MGLLSFFFCATLATMVGTEENSPTFTINDKNFKIPIYVDPERLPEIKQIRLFVSTDKGKTWKQIKSVPVGKGSVNYYAPKDGLYWFKIQAVRKDKQLDPEDIDEVPPSLRVLVQTTGEARQSPESPEKEIAKLRAHADSLQMEISDLRGKLAELEKKLGEGKPHPKP